MHLNHVRCLQTLHTTYTVRIVFAVFDVYIYISVVRGRSNKDCELTVQLRCLCRIVVFYLFKMFDTDNKITIACAAYIVGKSMKKVGIYKKKSKIKKQS